MIDQKTIIARLTAAVPELQPMLAAHLKENGELLTHLFLNEVSTFVMELDERRESRDAALVLAAILSALETCFEDGTEDGKNLISVSFTENIMERALESPEFRSKLGPALSSDLTDMLQAYGFEDDSGPRVSE